MHIFVRWEALCSALLLCLFPLASWAAVEEAPGRALARQTVKDDDVKWITADHSKFPILKQQFDSPEAVTKACLSCHNEAAEQIHKTIHWTWKDPADPTGDTGKGGVSVNNFCIAVGSNEPRCTSCHIGYGWKDKNFDFTSAEKVDCLVCHEQTGTYEKFPTKAGYPVTNATMFGGKTEFLPPDYNKVAQSVARPGRDNCGTCHFYGGGGDGVKHGDLDSSMTMPNKQLDVHMGTDGQNFHCTRCHTTDAHNIAGRIYATPASEDRKSLLEDDLTPKIMCESCHGAEPHKTNQKANDHTDKVSCQACHIPTYARINPTKMYWDWSTAGDKKREVKKDEFGKPDYDPKKGDFVWGKNEVPRYEWFNGSIRGTTAKDVVDPSKPVRVSWPIGDVNDPKSRIFPFKVHAGKTPYDKVNKTMVIPKLFGPKGSGAYWAEYDWDKAISAGQSYNDLPYSGEYDFVETEYVFPITHMVAPKDQAVACVECHAKGGRLDHLEGFYMPGRDSVQILNMGGWALVAASLLGVALHGLGRFFSSVGRRRG
jgi:octaheme c-type cytochrome (tetrathionate reductase family)